ncbi:unnamed protein product [Cylicocyclus nassatus]|uniref:Potassium channel tetramerisation-type BTB domain-containing protein n=1 Tax=Cylicocyclus nassatus TaxID=53992 RepID=A0AA36DUF5_CYLNA|nr:unnamed protein product [Cylicocyclus nassatus]
MPVVLNVGGTKFFTSLETVKKNLGPRDKSIFANMNVVEGKEIFIDRDPTHFRYILNYLRDGYVRVDGNAAIRAQLKREAQVGVGVSTHACCIECWRGEVLYFTRAMMKNPGPRDRSMLTEMDFMEGEEVFIDRDPTHFNYILNYLRDGVVSVNGSGNIRAQLKREAQFYGLESLVQHIEGQSQPTTVETLPPEVFGNLTPGPYFAIPIPRNHDRNV